MRPISAIWNMPDPTFLSAINIKVICAHPHVQWIRDAAAFVCAEFDMLHCAISLRVNADLSYSFAASKEAMEAWEFQHLRLRDVCFRGDEMAVEKLMTRILKYIERGFSFRNGDAVERQIHELVKQAMHQVTENLLSTRFGKQWIHGDHEDP